MFCDISRCLSIGTAAAATDQDGDDEDDAVDGQDDGKCANRSSSSCKAIAQ